jgi:two-component system cell cycle sensor histidine kinase/response regulator CckA
MTTTKTILIVDDEEIVRELLVDMLSDAGFQVVTAENGLIAIDLFKKPDTRFDLVVVDMSMPYMDGPEVCREIRKINSSQKLIIATGSYLTDEEIGELKENGITQIIRKPFHMGEMLSLFERVMGRE